MKRCDWAKSELDKKYHDTEWGKPLHGDQAIFELLILETMQAGLSWSTVLTKRENFRQALDGFDYQKIALYNEEKKSELLTNAGLIRNKLKIHSIIKNAQAFLRVQEEFTSFDDYLWSFVDGKPIVNQFEKREEVPTETELSQKLAKDLKKRGFSFVGPVTCYAFIQASGLVNDHLLDCDFY
ncbi:DNA-3-methyladenine glycosylase I [Carnobacterium gallinarum]|uniref:DNA-3-methyladenine glycosylase I n=1 Tax=Carnobacterium gallinarum TaxID=2749 RepID=UPI00054FDF99|nr:DNA-3-methyladenine glycosylase I [Carnobacterium gallinarum]